MKKVFTLFIMILFHHVSIAQKNAQLSIELDLDDQNNEYTKKTNVYVLSKNDSIIKKSIHCPSYDGEWIVDSLTQGYYDFKLLFNDSLYFSFPNLYVEKNKKTTYRFDISSYKTKLPKNKPLNDTIIHCDKGEFTFGGLYGNNTNEQNNKILQNESYSAEIATNVYHTLFKYYSIGFKMGYQYSGTIFKNDTTHINGEKTLHKYYSYNDLNLGLINRLTFFNNYKNKDGLKLDIGVIYHFPLFFKQVLKVNDDTKMITRHIHNYTDFTAMVRLGYKYVGLQAEYSLTTFLRKSYTEIPQLRVGLVFYIPLMVN